MEGDAGSIPGQETKIPHMAIRPHRTAWQKQNKTNQNTIFPLFVAPFLFPTGYRTFKLAVYHVMKSQAEENRSRRRGQNRTIRKKSG